MFARIATLIKKIAVPAPTFESAAFGGSVW
jgi:hypothetical protein